MGSQIRAYDIIVVVVEYVFVLDTIYRLGHKPNHSPGLTPFATYKGAKWIYSYAIYMDKQVAADLIPLVPSRGSRTFSHIKRNRNFSLLLLRDIADWSRVDPDDLRSNLEATLWVVLVC